MMQQKFPAVSSDDLRSVSSRKPNERLQFLIDLAANPPSKDECVLWPFSKSLDTYGMVLFEGRSQNASRVALILHTGQNPSGMHACHGPCHQRACCNPFHLSWQTPQQNSLDRRRDGTALGPHRTDPSLPECSAVDCSHKASLDGMCLLHWRRNWFEERRIEILSALSTDLVTPKNARKMVVRNGGVGVQLSAFVGVLDKLVKSGDLLRHGKKYRVAEK